MNNDFAKSILDNPYNRVEDGQKVTLMEILLKYDHQRSGEKFESDEQFYDLQRQSYGEVVIELS